VRAPLILIPPSEAKREGGRQRARVGSFDDDLAEARGVVAARLRELVQSAPDARLAEILGVRGTLFERARHSTVAMLDGRAPLMPVWQRYSGVVWSHLEPDTLTAAQRRRLIVPSGLYGLNAGDDVIADYRLKMSARLGRESMSTFWRSRLSTSLVRIANDRVVYDMLPLEHRAALIGLGSHVRLMTVTFTHGANGRLAGHDAKAAKGAFARHLIVGATPEAFAWRGWSAHAHDGEIRVVYGA
jgi:uncharacterized protein